MELKFILFGLILVFIYVLVITYLVKNQTKINKSITFVRRIPTEVAIQKLFFQGYTWIYDSSTSKAVPGVLVHYYENNKPVRIAVPEEYFNSKYVSLLEKEKEDDNRG